MTELMIWLEQIIRSYGWGGFFVGTLLEEIILPLPSSLIMMGGGFFLIHADSAIGALRQVIFPFIPVGLGGVMIGSLLWYGLAYWGEEFTVKRVGKYIGISWDEVRGIERYFKKQHTDEWMLLALRAIPIFPGALTAIFSGLIRMPLRKFVVFGSIGTMIRLALMGSMGWFFQEMYVVYANRFEDISTIMTIGMIACITAAYILFKKRIHVMITRSSS